MNRRVILAASFCLFSWPASAATVDLHKVKWMDNPTGKLVTVRVQQEIDYGDLDRIKKQLHRADMLGWTVVAFEMDSWGGNGNECMAIAEYVHNNNMPVYVNSQCKSGCSFAAWAALANGNLIIGPWAKLGVHQAFYGDAAEHNVDMTWTEWAANTMMSWGVPRDPMDAMLSQPPDGFTYFNAGELMRLGATKADVSMWGWLWGG